MMKSFLVASAFLFALFMGRSLVTGQQHKASLFFDKYHQEWKPAMFTETGCPKQPFHQADLKINEDFINSVDVWDVPMASKHIVAYWSGLLLNRPAKERETHRACFRYLFLAPTLPYGVYYNIISGFGNGVTITCKRTAYLTQTCKVDRVAAAHSFGRLPVHDLVSVSKIVDTDNSSWLLFVRCLNASIKDWFVLAKPGTPLTVESHHEIMFRLNAYGFRPDGYTWNLNRGGKCLEDTEDTWWKQVLENAAINTVRGKGKKKHPKKHSSSLPSSPTSSNLVEDANEAETERTLDMTVGRPDKHRRESEENFNIVTGDWSYD